jgi:hypothetical protein
MGIEEARPRHTRPRFYDLCLMYNLSLQDVEKQAGVSSSVVEALFLGNPVRRSDAEKVLATVSECTGVTYHLDSTTVPLLPDEQQMKQGEV